MTNALGEIIFTDVLFRKMSLIVSPGADAQSGEKASALAWSSPTPNILILFTLPNANPPFDVVGFFGSLAAKMR